MPRKNYFSYKFSLLLSLLYNRFLYNCIYTSNNGKKTTAVCSFMSSLLCWILLFKQQILKLKWKYFHSCSLLSKEISQWPNPQHADLHVQPLSNSQAHCPLPSSPPVILNKPSFSIPWQSWIASFFHLISNFLISYPLPSGKTSFPGNNFVTLSQAEYRPTLCPDVWGMK